MEVTAKKRRFIDGRFREIGDTFDIKENDFCDDSMAKGKVSIPEPKITHARLKTTQQDSTLSGDIEMPPLENAFIQKRKKRVTGTLSIDKKTNESFGLRT